MRSPSWQEPSGRSRLIRFSESRAHEGKLRRALVRDGHRRPREPAPHHCSQGDNNHRGHEVECDGAALTRVIRFYRKQLAADRASFWQKLLRSDSLGLQRRARPALDPPQLFVGRAALNLDFEFAKQ